MDFDQQKAALAAILLPFCPFMAVDATRADVEVPESLRSTQLVLRIGRDKQVLGMPDLVLDERGWSATISIRGALFKVKVPWVAVQAMFVGEPFSGPSIAWPEFADVEEVNAAPARPKLSVVKGGG